MVYLLVLVLFVLMIVWHWQWTCYINLIWIVLNMLIVLTLTILSFVTRRPDVNILNTSLYCLYITYYFYSALGNSPSSYCNDVHSSTLFIISEVIIGFIVVTTMFVYLAYERSLPFIPRDKKAEEDEKEKLRIELERQQRTKTTVEAKYQRAIDHNAKNASEAFAKLEYRTLKYLWLFMAFCMLSMYFMNIITNWGTVAVFDEVYDYGTDLAGYFAKLFIALFTTVFYFVVLILPMIFRDRDFGENPYAHGTGGKEGGEKHKKVSYGLENDKELEIGG